MVPAMPSSATARLRAASAGLSLGCAALTGCIVTPRDTQVYDPDCKTYVKQVVLESREIGALGHCSNDGCAVLLASMGIVAAASAVISGSVAVVGNIAYWMERRGQCPQPAGGEP
jgi:hypothetical protein